MKSIDEILKNMTVEEKIGQLILGQAIEKEMMPDFEEFIRKYPLGGYRISGSNIKDKFQVRSFTASINEIYSQIGCGVEPILGCDEEGGTLSVFRGIVTEFPGNMALGAADSIKLSYLQGNCLGYELSEMGLNMVFAPVADINLQIDNPVIGVRSFGDNPLKVAKHCVSYAAGLNSGGMANCGKHFPGHGNTNVDSHKELPYNSVDLSTLEKSELIPFKGLVEMDVDSIMISHVLYPNITRNSMPSSLSEDIVTGILRNRLGYDGVVMSDDMEMKAIVNNYSIGKAVKMFIQSGGDIALVNGSHSSVIEAFESLRGAVLSGEINVERINSSIKRILSLKEKIISYKKGKTLITSNPEMLSAEISTNAITLVRDNNGVLPLKPGSKVLLIIPRLLNLTDADTSADTENQIYKFIKTYCPNSKVVNIDLGRTIEFEKVLNRLEKFDVVIQCTINCSRFKEQVELINKISDRKPVVAIMVRDPYDAVFLPKQPAVIGAYSASEESMSGAAELLFGENSFHGRLPVNIG